MNAPISLPVIPAQIADCPGPVPIDWNKVQNGLMPADAVYQGWGADRRNLAICDRRHDNLVRYYSDLQAGFLMVRDASGFPPM